MTEIDNTTAMHATCTAFPEGGDIPIKHTCDGENVNPPFEIWNTPQGTATLAIIMEDIDIPKDIRPDGLWDHWVVFNIPPSTNEILNGKEPKGLKGVTSAGKMGYFGPCPPSGAHRYRFTFYAVDIELPLGVGVTKDEVLGAMDGHVVESAVYTGRYVRAI